MSAKIKERSYVDICREYYESIPHDQVSFKRYISYVDFIILNENMIKGVDILYTREAIDLNIARELYDALAAIDRAVNRIHKKIEKRIAKLASGEINNG